jgi:hypothetical protein
MADPSNLPNVESGRTGETSRLPAGLHPVSPDRFEEIIEADRDGRFSIHPQQRRFDLKSGKLGIANWVMAVVAGLVLGVVMTMIAAM